jgi:hypothetical protein
VEREEQQSRRVRYWLDSPRLEARPHRRPATDVALHSGPVCNPCDRRTPRFARRRLSRLVESPAATGLLGTVRTLYTNTLAVSRPVPSGAPRPQTPSTREQRLGLPGESGPSRRREESRLVRLVAPFCRYASLRSTPRHDDRHTLVAESAANRVDLDGDQRQSPTMIRTLSACDSCHDGQSWDLWIFRTFANIEPHC